MMNLASLIGNACYTSTPETFIGSAILGTILSTVAMQRRKLLTPIFCQLPADHGKETAKWRFSGGACEPDYARWHTPSRHLGEKFNTRV
jgi:hypothetical protein